MAGVRRTLSGAFDLDGTANVMVRRSGQTPLFVSLLLDLENAAGRISGSVSNVDWIADLAGNRAIFNAKTNPAPQEGRYVFNIPGGDDAAVLPGGDSYATVMVDKTGKIVAAVSLADNTKFTQSLPISADGTWPLFAALYSGHGSIMGWMSFTNPPPSVLAGNLTWHKPADTAKFYPAGFVAVSAASGGVYQRPTNGASILNATNATFVLLGGDLAASITNQITLNGHSQVTNLGPQPLKLTFSLSSGLFTGSIVDPASLRKISFGGVIRQDLDAGDGFFVGTNQTGRVLLLPAAP
jgi:hypothetical protein